MLWVLAPLPPKGATPPGKRGHPPFVGKTNIKKSGYFEIMRDSDVRTAVKDCLHERYRHDPRTRIVEEMGLWSGSVRVDIAVINGELQGFELKSDRDTLARLGGQAALYNQVFDRVTLVTGARHLDKALVAIPGWWGVACASMEPGGRPSLSLVRRALRNPGVEAIQLARLLWRPEALAILEHRGFSKGYKSRTAEVVARRLTEVLSLSDLAAEVRETLKSRPNWLGQTVGNQRQMTVGQQPSPHRPTAASGRSTRDLLDSIISQTSDL